MDIVIQLLFLVVGFVLLIKGANWFVDSASGIAERFGIPKIVIGLTIVAFGTSAPEAAVSISSALQGSAELAVSNVLGSNILNVFIIIGVAAVLCPLAVQKSTVKVDIPFVLVVSIAMLLLGRDTVMTRLDGVILWVFFIVYLVYMVKMALNGQSNSEEESGKKEEKLWKQVLFLILGGAGIVLGADVTVNAASELASMFGMSERLVGLTIVAFGTSLPELVTSCIAAKKKEADIAIGNVVGSNLFNIMFVLGTTALITPTGFDPAFMFDNIVSIVSIIFIWFFVRGDRKVSRGEGVFLLVCYAAYFVKILIG